MRKNKFGDYTVYCDSCPDFCDTVEDTPDGAWLEAQAEGWTRIWADDHYVYKCPDCAKAEPKNKLKTRKTKGDWLGC